MEAEGMSRASGATNGIESEPKLSLPFSLISGARA
jgi:hypothetical protein